jgi:hypothetical protein
MKQLPLKEYVDEFDNDSAAARSLNVSPQRLYFNMLNHEKHFVQINKDNIKLCRVLSKAEKDNENSSTS